MNGQFVWYEGSTQGARPARSIFLLPGILMTLIGMLILAVPQILVVAVAGFFLTVGIYMILAGLKR